VDHKLNVVINPVATASGNFCRPFAGFGVLRVVIPGFRSLRSLTRG